MGLLGFTKREAFGVHREATRFLDVGMLEVEGWLILGLLPRQQLLSIALPILRSGRYHLVLPLIVG